MKGGKFAGCFLSFLLASTVLIVIVMIMIIKQLDFFFPFHWYRLANDGLEWLQWLSYDHRAGIRDFKEGIIACDGIQRCYLLDWFSRGRFLFTYMKVRLAPDLMNLSLPC